MAPPEVVSMKPCPVARTFVERPLLFSGAMVLATLRADDPKTQTRRVIKGLTEKMWVEESEKGGFSVCYHGDPTCGTGVWDVPEHSYPITCPYGQPGDRLWVRETHFAWGRWETRYSVKKGRDEWHFVDLTLECGHEYAYAADGHSSAPHRRSAGTTPCWWKRPAIFMPRAASRIDLEVTGVRVEQLQRISESDCYAEGIDTEGAAYNEGENYVNAGSPVPAARWAYNTLWEEINGKGPYHWEANPWVWVVKFRRNRP